MNIQSSYLHTPDVFEPADRLWEPPQLLTLPDPRKLTTSIRATAQVFEDPRSVALLERIRMVAPSDASVLIIGETGTGKELIARHVHDLSQRRSRPFVAVNCGAFSETLVESELFGHEKGAFTGAFAAKTGWLKRPMAAPCFWTRLGTCRCPSRSSCCGCCRSVKWCGWARARACPSTCVWWRPPMCGCRTRWPLAISAKTCSTACMWCNWRCPRCAIGRATSCRWRAISSRNTAAGSAMARCGWMRRPSASWASTAGPAISASWKT